MKLEVKLLADLREKSDGVQMVVSRPGLHKNFVHPKENVGTKVDQDVGRDGILLEQNRLVTSEENWRGIFFFVDLEVIDTWTIINRRVL